MNDAELIALTIKNMLETINILIDRVKPRSKSMKIVSIISNL